MKLVGGLLSRHIAEGALVLDVGSRIESVDYTHLVAERGWRYVGVDIRGGTGVSAIVGEYGPYPFRQAGFDIVLSVLTMEHIRHVWEWLPAIATQLRPGGLLALLTYWRAPVHAFPVDCWRFLPDGLRVLFDWVGTLSDYEIIKQDGMHVTATAVKA